MAEPTSGNQLAQQFQACRPAFCAIGDETRQLILRVFIENCGTGGLRVGELQASTNLSRAAVSLLQDAVRQMKHCPTYQEEGEHK